jgi:capsular polysaccharide transport system permease protein
MPGLDFAVFVASGFIVFFLFRNTLTSAMNAFESNQALFVYAQVKPIHTIISRALVEFLVSSCVFLFFFFIGWYLHFDVIIDDVLMFLLCVLWIQILGLSLGLLIAVVSTFYETLKRIVKIILSPLMFLSAIFYTVDSLPTFLREIILYNPLAHFMELLHGSYFHVLDTHYVDYEYMIYWTIIPLFLGLYLYLKTEKKIQST